MGRHAGPQLRRYTGLHTGVQIGTQAGAKAGRLAGTHAGMQAGWHACRHAGRQALTHTSRVASGSVRWQARKHNTGRRPQMFPRWQKDRHTRRQVVAQARRHAHSSASRHATSLPVRILDFGMAMVNQLIKAVRTAML